jgi:beta-N-acetylhexosaminidase
MSDDKSMGALSGSLAERARASLAAGCDVDHNCNGELAEMREIAAVTPMLSGVPHPRAEDALAQRHAPTTCDLPQARTAFAALLKGERPASARMAS